MTSNPPHLFYSHMEPPSPPSTEVTFLYFNDLYEIDNVGGNGGLGMLHISLLMIYLHT